MIRKIASKFKNEIILRNLKKQFSIEGKKIFLFGSPYHSNMGDQAQTYCSMKWFEKYYPDYTIFEFNTVDIYRDNYKLLNIIKEIITKRDIIFLHSGYHTTDLYMLEENMQREVVKRFPNNKVVVLPQTILYENDIERETSKQIYNAHNDLTFLCRDQVSFKTAEKLLYNCKRMLYPDIVTTLIGTKEYSNARNGILFCMRNDKEAHYKSEVIDEIKDKLSEISKVDMTDTTIDIKCKEIIKDREKILFNMFEEYSKYEVIVTDRYHGTIFSLISNTPVIVLSSSDHKLESGVKWFPQEFEEYVTFLSDINELQDKIIEILNKKYDYKLPQYFNDVYYSRLKEKLGE